MLVAVTFVTVTLLKVSSPTLSVGSFSAPKAIEARATRPRMSMLLVRIFFLCLHAAHLSRLPACGPGSPAGRAGNPFAAGPVTNARYHGGYASIIFVPPFGKTVFFTTTLVARYHSGKCDSPVLPDCSSWQVSCRP